MEILYLLLPIVLLSVIVAIALFFWATNNGQFDDLDSPAFSIFDENDTLEPEHPAQVSQQHNTQHDHQP